MHPSALLSETLHLLYRSVGHPAALQPFARHMADLLGAHSGILGVLSRSDGSLRKLSWTDNFEGDMGSAQSVRIFRQTVVNSHVGNVDQGVIDLREVMSEREFSRTDFYNDYCKPSGFFHIAGGWVEYGKAGDLVMLGVHRDRSHHAFDDEIKQRIGLLLPHLQQALTLRETLGEADVQRRASMPVLDALSIGAFLVDPTGRIRYANPQAEALLRKGVGLKERHRRLQLSENRQAQSFQNALAQATAADLRSMPVDEVILINSGSPEALAVRVSMAPEDLVPADAPGRYAFVFVSSHQIDTASLGERLRRLYGLTPAEAALAAAITDGESLVEFSERTAISINTAKTHLKRIFGKTGHHRQSQFVRDMLANPVLQMNATGRDRVFDDR